MLYKRNSKIKTAAQKKLLFIMLDQHTLWIRDNDRCGVVDMPEHEIQVRTCNQLIKGNLIKIVHKEPSLDGEICYYKISLEGKMWCEKAMKRKQNGDSDGISEESVDSVQGE